MLRFTTILPCVWLAVACAGSPAERSAGESEPGPTPADPTPAGPLVEYQPALGERIAAAGYVGTFVLLDPAAGRVILAEPEPAPGEASLADTRFLPASTFKIPTALIALETGVADGPEFALAWDHVTHEIEAWNHDHVLRTAFASSVVWYFQELARRIGAERMQGWLDTFEYGNRQIGVIDRFWLDGPLAISPREQVEFLRRLHAGELGISASTRAVMLDDVMIHQRREDGTIVRAKTGWGEGDDRSIGWFVGSVELPDRAPVYFATLILADAPASDSFREDRRALAYALLGELGMLTGDLTPP